MAGEARMTLTELAVAVVAAAAAGLVNALAGGGTLISFPVLLAAGVPPIVANVTNAVALCPGYLGAVLAQRDQLRAQRGRLWWCVPAAMVGGAAGACILLLTRERTFQILVPYMIAAAALLVALQERVRAWVILRLARGTPVDHVASAAMAVLLAGIYGGFFSAGMSVIVLGVLALTLDESLARLNALKQAVALAVNLAATLVFVFSGQVLWRVAALMAVGAWFGGVLGGRLSDRIRPTFLRWTVVVTALMVAVAYWVR
jgi:uncharacterized protein